MKQWNKNTRMEEEHETQAGRSVRKLPEWFFFIIFIVTPYMLLSYSIIIPTIAHI